MALVKQVRLGQSGLKIAPILVGCMSYGSKKWSDWVIEDKEEVFALLKYCYDRGLRTFDTADVYSNGQSERLVGEFLKKYNIPRERVVILSKVFFYVNETFDERFKDVAALPRLPNDDEAYVETLNQVGLSRKHILDAVEKSVQRLGTYIDVLQIHRYDPNTPNEEVMRALNDVVTSGKVRYIGASSMRATNFVELQHTAEKHGWVKFISQQFLWNLLYRENERELVPYCKRTGVGLIPWSPLAGGLLCRQWEDMTSERAKSDAFSLRAKNPVLAAMSEKIVNRVGEVAKKRGVPMATLATAWVLHQGAFPILGLSKRERVDEAISALDLKLTQAELKYLEEPYLAQPLAENMYD